MLITVNDEYDTITVSTYVHKVAFPKQVQHRLIMLAQPVGPTLTLDRLTDVAI